MVSVISLSSLCSIKGVWTARRGGLFPPLPPSLEQGLGVLGPHVPLWGRLGGNWLIRSVIGLLPSPRHVSMEPFACFGFGRRTRGPWCLRVRLRKVRATWRTQSARQRRRQCQEGQTLWAVFQSARTASKVLLLPGPLSRFPFECVWLRACVGVKTKYWGTP